LPGFALLLLWGPYGTLGRLLTPHGVQLMFTAGAIIWRNIFVTFPLAFGVIKPVLRHDEPSPRRSFGNDRRDALANVLGT
jgi:ABC-type sulfate transport system permease subunit